MYVKQGKTNTSLAIMRLSDPCWDGENVTRQSKVGMVTSNDFLCIKRSVLESPGKHDVSGQMIIHQHGFP